jgi:hypothetical protein
MYYYIIQNFIFTYYKRRTTASVVYWSEFLTTDPTVSGSIPVHYKKKK